MSSIETVLVIKQIKIKIKKDKNLTLNAISKTTEKNKKTNNPTRFKIKLSLYLL